MAMRQPPLGLGLWAERVPALLGGPECAGHSGQSMKWELPATSVSSQRPNPVSSTVITVTYLPSSQKSKCAKHFLELKSFKDNNTLESTL
ncbi:hypothetical protein QTO34_002213 [Cnephaeus nilssonii]|uniref:Uncharacterized protein n=1 Tax=Cnephaeus nilssonii TaxID=3371016 RepID=A0AA40HVC3_CNENI|nr:hypothetical protein QTO34_002213 [Eptesicus nilssonii]